jgi:hypothetical protein
MLLSYIQEILDESPKTGIFLLTGSHQPELHQKNQPNPCRPEYPGYYRNGKVYKLIIFC